MYIKHPRQLAAAVHTAINALLKKRNLTGGGPSLASRSPLRRLPLKPRWRPKKQSKFTVSDQRSLSSRTPGSKSDVAFGNFDAADKKRHPWKLLGLASVTTSSAGSAYSARSLPKLQRLAKRSAEPTGPVTLKKSLCLPMLGPYTAFAAAFVLLARTGHSGIQNRRTWNIPAKGFLLHGHIDFFTGSGHLVSKN